MGFIKQLLNGLFSFLGNIFGGLAKLVGLGKKSEYFLEADPIDSGAVSSPAAQSVVAAKTSSANGQSVAPEAAIASSTALIAAEQGASNGSATAKKSKVSKKALKADAEAAKAKTTESAKAPTPVVAAASAVPVNVTFAPNYLMTANSRSGRRRPGPSMNQFRDMARQVNSQN